jgi:ornithine carbamoyltransferase
MGDNKSFIFLRSKTIFLVFCKNKKNVKQKMLFLKSLTGQTLSVYPPKDCTTKQDYLNFLTNEVGEEGKKVTIIVQGKDLSKMTEADCKDVDFRTLLNNLGPLHYVLR